MQKRKGICLTVVAVGLSFVLSGCAGKERVAVREDLARAEGMIQAAEIIGADAHAPEEMQRARREINRAEYLLNREPGHGRLSLDLQQKKDDKRRSADSVRHALADTSQALSMARAEWQASGRRQASVSDLSPEVLADLRHEIEKELNKNRQAAQQCKDRLDSVTTALGTCRNQQRLAEARLKNVSRSVDRNQNGLLYSALYDEFAADLDRWNAKLDPYTLSIRFIGTATAFKSGSTWVNHSLRRVMESFFPRLLKVISRPPFKDRIAEIRVEGYSSRGYLRAKGNVDRYYRNLLLSQLRAANTVDFLLRLAPAERRWLQSHLVAVGMSDSHPVYGVNGVESKRRSRRIEFRIVPARGYVPTRIASLR